MWGWPGSGPLDSLEYQQQVQLWHRTLDEFRAYDAVCKPMDFARALQLLRTRCAGQISQPATADCKIQVLGPLEAAGLAFDELWLCTVQAGRWPAPAGPTVYTPGCSDACRCPTPPRSGSGRSRQGCLAVPGGAGLHASYCRLLDEVPELPSALLADFEPAEVPRQRR